MAYTYQADVWCDACGEAIMARIRAEHPELVPEDPMDEASYDSEDWPKGYLPKSEESDGPQNCAGGDCGGEYHADNQADTKYLAAGVSKYGTFLENQLTSEGYQYLKGMLDESGKELPTCAQEWADYYGFTWREECEVCKYDADDCTCENPLIVAEWHSYEME
jgi:hypothetical protein